MSKSTICPLPWNHLATHPDGHATLCCVSDHTNSRSSARTNSKILNLNSNTVIEIINSDTFTAARQQMASGERPQSCLRCYRDEDRGISSKRQMEIERWGNDYTGVTIEPDLKFIELRLGNLCNVRCRTCNPHSSTQWLKEYPDLQAALPFVTRYDTKINTRWTESDVFWTDLLANSANVEVIYINGGEPTLVEQHWIYLERLINHGLNHKIKLWYSINMTNLPDKLLDLWRQFKEVEVHASIDDLDNRNSYIRRGTSWTDVLANLDKLRNNPWITSSVTQTVSWMNIYYVPEFRQAMNNLGFSVNTNIVNDPIFYSPHILPIKLKDRLEDKLAHYPEVLLNVSTRVNIDLFNQGIQYNEYLDRTRLESYNDIFPEWATIIKQL